MTQKILFLDRDGTLIDEVLDQRVDSLAKIKLKTNVIPALLQLQKAGYGLVMVTNQEGIGSAAFPQAAFMQPHNFLMAILNSQGISFAKVLICPHTLEDHCRCRKPQLGLVQDYLNDDILDRQHSYVIGDRLTDMEFAQNMGIKGILYDGTRDWLQLAAELITLYKIA